MPGTAVIVPGTVLKVRKKVMTAPKRIDKLPHERNGPLASEYSTTKPRSTLPSVRNYVASLMPAKWHLKEGAQLDRALYSISVDEASKNKIMPPKAKDE